MPALTIKNIPNDLYLELKLAAKRHHRSINSEVIVCLKHSLQPVRINPEDRLRDIRLLRSRIRPLMLSQPKILTAPLTKVGRDRC